jgi:hypothetical protein
MALMTGGQAIDSVFGVVRCSLLLTCDSRSPETIAVLPVLVSESLTRF